MQLCGVNLLFPCSLAAVHVSSDVIPHHQEYLNCSYNFWFYLGVFLSATFVADKELLVSWLFYMFRAMLSLIIRRI
jgi:hypothetical protein